MLKIPTYTPEALKRLKDAADAHEALVERTHAEAKRTGNKNIYQPCTDSALAYKALCETEYQNATKGA